MRFNSPPGWPTPPPGWMPPAGWQPNPAWPPAPAGWVFYVEDGSPFSGPPVGGPNGVRADPQGAPFQQMVTTRPNRPWYQKKRFLIPIGGFVVLVLIGIFAPKDPNSNVKVADAPAPAVSQPAQTTTAPPPATAKATTAAAKATTAAPEPTTIAPAAKPKPKPTKKVTSGQRNAVAKAEEYLSFTAFSRKGLIKQLKFEKFSTSDATYAVDHVGANWNKQAVAKAKEYLSNQSFSRAGLITQLEFEGFTRAQAKHGVAVAY